MAPGPWPLLSHIKPKSQWLGKISLLLVHRTANSHGGGWPGFQAGYCSGTQSDKGSAILGAILDLRLIKGAAGINVLMKKGRSLGGRVSGQGPKWPVYMRPQRSVGLTSATGLPPNQVHRGAGKGLGPREALLYLPPWYQVGRSFWKDGRLLLQEVNVKPEFLHPPPRLTKTLPIVSKPPCPPRQCPPLPWRWAPASVLHPLTSPTHSGSTPGTRAQGGLVPNGAGAAPGPSRPPGVQSSLRPPQAPGRQRLAGPTCGYRPLPLPS